MERLTFDGNFCDIAQCRELPCPYDNNCMQKQVWERLKSYEDIGLSPEGVKNARDYVLGRTLVEVSEYDGFPAWRLREFTTAEREGRLLILPCKVGDTVWIIPDNKRVCECEVLFIDSAIGNLTVVFGSKFGLKGTLQRSINAFGKTIFLTREEAEKALEERRNKQ